MGKESRDGVLIKWIGWGCGLRCEGIKWACGMLGMMHRVEGMRSCAWGRGKDRKENRE